MKKTKQDTLVNFILDKSGSMSVVHESTISGFNEYVSSLKKDGNKYNFSLVLFDTVLNELYTNEPIKNIKEINKEIYSPDGNTALYDTVCSTIDKVRNTVKEDQKVLTVIMTDGQENSSKEYTEIQLKKKIEELEKTGKWSFVFLGANQDSWATAQKFGISQMNTANFVASDAGMQKAMYTMAANTRNFAMNAQSSTASFFSKDDQEDLMMGQSGTTGTASPSLNLQSSSPISQHFSDLGKKSWEARKKRFLGQ